jgi:putative SbcD/Mre11-related phosphoesterase
MRVLDDWLLTPERTALHLPSATAVVADLHLGYDQARRRQGEAVPEGALAAHLAPLAAALGRHGVRRLVVAGDLLEDGRCAGTAAEFRHWLEGTGVELVAVVPGNHDRRAPACCPPTGSPPGQQAGGGDLAGLPVRAEGVGLGGWRVVHGDGPLPHGPLVHGHEHPWVRWRDRRRVGLPPLSAPCYLVGERRLVLPAFSPDAAGVNVLGVRRWRTYRCCVIAGDRVLDFGDVARLRSRV